MVLHFWNNIKKKNKSLARNNLENMYHQQKHSNYKYHNSLRSVYFNIFTFIFYLTWQSMSYLQVSYKKHTNMPVYLQFMNSVKVCTYCWCWYWYLWGLHEHTVPSQLLLWSGIHKRSYIYIYTILNKFCENYN